jgi:hypothetical protein
MAARLKLSKAPVGLRARLPLAQRPVVQPTILESRSVAVRAAEDLQLPSSDDDFGEPEMDAVQKRRAMNEEQVQAQGRYARGGRNDKEEWEDKIIQVCVFRPSFTCTCRRTCSFIVCCGGVQMLSFIYK